MPAINDQLLGTWIGRIIRWTFGLLLAWVAFSYEEPFLYGVGAIVFATGFLRPKRCNADGCNLE
jgi:hypothetical protein